MSRVILLAADHPLLYYQSDLQRPSRPSSGPFLVTLPPESYCFSVQPHEYYRPAVEELGLEIKPYQYELNLKATGQDAQQLRDYLARHCKAGEQVELWNLWVGDMNARSLHLTGPLSDLDQDTLEQLFEKDQTCMTITI